MSVARFRSLLDTTAVEEIKEPVEVANLIKNVIIPVFEDIKTAISEKLPDKKVEITKSSHAVVLTIYRSKTKLDIVNLYESADKLQANLTPTDSGKIKIALTLNSESTEPMNYLRDELKKDLFEDFVADYCVKSGFAGLVKR